LLTWLRELAQTVGTFDRSAFEPGYALRCTAGVAIPLAAAMLLREPALGVPAAIGAFITGFTSLQGIYRTRLAAVLAAALGMALASFVGALAAHSTAAIVVATALAGYACSTIGQLSPAASTVTLNSFVAFVLFSSQALAPAAAAQDSALVLAGGILQAALLLLAWPSARGRVERMALADVYRNLSVYASAVADGSAGLPPITPLATARQVLADPQPFARASDVARFTRLLEDAEVIRRRLGALAATPHRSGDATAARAVAKSVADRLSAIADVLTGDKSESQIPEISPPADRLRFAGVEDMAAHLRDAAEATAMLTGGRLPRFYLLSQARPAPYTRSHIDWLGRDALRFPLVLAIAMALGRHFAADRGYWIPMTAAIVLKPDLRTTFVRGVARIGGTMVGALVAGAVMTLVRGRTGLEVAGITLASFVAYLTFNPNYALFTIAITSFVVMVLGMRGLPGTTTIEARLLDTLAGGALAMIGYIALPSWEHKRTRALLADYLDTQRRVAEAILRASAKPAGDARRALAEAREDAWKARTVVEASIDRSRQEPRARHTIGPGRALRVLSATQRFALATLALETVLETQPSPRIEGDLEAFAGILDDEMSELVRALRESRPVPPNAAMTAKLAQLDTELAGEPDPARRFILERLRAYVEATIRIARLVGQKRTRGDYA